MLDYEQTSIKLKGNFYQSNLGRALLDSFYSALALEHKLSDDVVSMPGMSGKKYRYLINNLIEKIPDSRYLEVGSWTGSTACSAMYRNKLQITCIDDWSQFGGPKEQFLLNIKDNLTDEIDFNFIESDYKLVKFNDIGKYNVYLFDGPHEEVDQYRGIKMALPALDGKFILIVDDYNWPGVQIGTQRAIKEELTVLCDIEIKTTQNDTHPVKSIKENSDWHNGYYLALCRKSNVILSNSPHRVKPS